MNTETIVQLATIAISISAAAGSAIAWLAGRTGRKADVIGSLSHTINELSERIGKLEQERAKDYQNIIQQEAEIRQLQSMLSDCIVGLTVLTRQLRKAHIKPQWVPSSELKAWVKRRNQNGG